MQYFNLDIFKKKNNELKEDIICFNVEDQITSKVRDFYNVKPFPNYDNLENKHSLSIKGKNNLLLTQLKDFVGYKKNFLEVGSGTCQLSLYLSIGTNNNIFALDPTLKKLKISEDQKKAWIRDQYEHPVESLHTFDEILDWFEKNNIEFINSIPASNLFSNEINLFEKTKKNNKLINLLIQFFMIFTKIGSDGGLFIFIGKKK